MAKILSSEPDGKCKDFPEGSATSMWSEKDIRCPNNADHKINGSTRRYTCKECLVWWWREGYGGSDNGK